MNKWKKRSEKTLVGLRTNQKSIVVPILFERSHYDPSKHRKYSVNKIAFDVNQEHGNARVIQSVFYFICSTCFFFVCRF